MNKKQKVLFQKAISVISGLVLVVQSLTPGFFVYAQETTPEPTVVETPIPTPVTTPEPTQEITTEPTPTNIVSPTPTEEITPTITPEDQQNEIGETPAATPTDIVSPTPSEDITPTVEPTETNGNTTSTEEPKDNSPPADDSKGEILDGVSTTAPTSNPTVEPVHEETGDLQAVILKNVEAPTLNLDGVNPDGSAQLSTDKADYAPTDTAIITGINFTPGKTYQLIISSSDNPPTSITIDIIADELGSFIYAYQLDGTYRPNYYVEVKDASQFIASTTFTDAASPEITWPSDWTTPNSCVSDPINDENPNSIDLTGLIGTPAVGFASDANYQFFRERVHGDPGSASNPKEKSWVVLFQLTTPRYQYLASLNGKDDKVQLWENTNPKDPGVVDFSPLMNDPAETLR